MLKNSNILTGAAMGFEQRKAQRVPLSVALNYTLDQRGMYRGKAINISETGLAFRGDVPLEKGKEIEVRLINPDNLNAVPIPAQVVDCAVDEAGDLGAGSSPLGGGVAVKTKSYVVRVQFVRVAEAIHKVIIRILEGVVGIGKYASRLSRERSLEAMVPGALSAQAKEISQEEVSKIFESKSHLVLAKIATAKQFPLAGPLLAKAIPEVLNLPLSQAAAVDQTVLVESKLQDYAYSFVSLAKVLECQAQADQPGRFVAKLKLFSLRQAEVAELEDQLSKK